MSDKILQAFPGSSTRGNETARLAILFSCSTGQSSPEKRNLVHESTTRKKPDRKVSQCGSRQPRHSKNWSNHSVRKTSISRLLDANVPENFVAQLSGHKNTQSLQSYKSASEHHQRQMSNTLSRTPNMSKDAQASKEQSMTTELVRQSTSSNSIAVTQASLHQLQSASDISSRAVFAGANISSITGCQFQIFTGPVKIIHESHKRRRVVIETKIMTKMF